MRSHFKYLLIVFFAMGFIFQGCETPKEIPVQEKTVEVKPSIPKEVEAKSEVKVAERSMLPEFPEKTEFVNDGKPNVLIVYGKENKDLAFKLRDKLKKMTGLEFPMMLDSDATGGKRWVLKDEVKNQNLLLLGNINNNRGILAVYAKFLAAASGKFPGLGKYVIRHLAEPFATGKTALVLGASDKTGLKKAFGRFMELLRNSQGNDKNLALGFPLLEFGGENGPLVEPSETDNSFYNYCDAAYVFYSGGSPAHCYAWRPKRSVKAAISSARTFVRKDLASKNPNFAVGGHYSWMRNYQALRIIVAHGLLNAGELRELSVKLFQNAVASKDGMHKYVPYFQKRRDYIMKDNYSPSYDRHTSSVIVGHFLMLDYLTNFGRLSDEKKAEIQPGYHLFEKLIKDWNKHRVFRGRVGDVGCLDCVDFLIDAFMYLGIESFVDNGMLRDMMNYYLCNVSNLWACTGSDFYIGAYQGAHISSPVGGLAVKAWAFFKHDQSLERLDSMRFEKAGTYQRGFKDSPPSICLGQPEPFSLPPQKHASSKLNCPFLMKTAPEPIVWKNAVAAAKNWKPKPSYSQGFNSVAFRDGWLPGDAFLSIKGSDSPQVWNVNTINCFTENDAAFLYGGSQSYETWSRNGVTVDSAKFAETATFAIRTSRLASEDAAIFASLCKSFNGCEWRRAIIRRKHGYFLVLDDLMANRDDDFQLTATWRALPICENSENGVLRATVSNGAQFALIPAKPYINELTRPAVDGVSRPTFYRQFIDKSMKKGEYVSFQNALSSAKKGEEININVKSLNEHMVLVKDNGKSSLAGTRKLPGGVWPTGECVAFYLTEEEWLLGGVKTVRLGSSELLRAERPVDINIDFGRKKAKLVIHDQKTSVLISKELGGDGNARELKPGEHVFDLELAKIANFDIQASQYKTPEFTPKNKKYPAIPSLNKKWNVVAQKMPPSVIQPIKVVANHKPATMAIHNTCDGVFPTSSYPTPIWKRSDLVLTIEQVLPTKPVTGLRILGNFGEIKVKALNASGEWKEIPFKTSHVTVFAGYSSHRVGSRIHHMTQFDFKTEARVIKLELKAKDRKKQSISVSEIQLLGPPAKNEVWGRLKIAKFAENSQPVLLCRTGTYADTVEMGGAIQAYSPEGKLLWKHDEAAPSQYRDKYWITGDVDGDGGKELITYSDDTVIKTFAPDGKLRESVDLNDWEEKKNGKKHKSIRYGGKSIALWPSRSDDSSDVMVFGHVHHHQIQLRPNIKITRRDRQPNIECAPAASATVSAWTGSKSQNLVGVAPWKGVVVLWENQSADKAPRLVESKNLAHPLVQLSANNQLPVFVECLKTANPAGIIAATPRGLQFFAKPDLKPGWVAGTMCPTSAAMVFNQNNGGADRVIIGRENGRVIIYDVATGKVLGEKLLKGAVRRIIKLNSGGFVVGTLQGVFILKKDLSVAGFLSIPVEDIAVSVKENERIAYVLSPSGELTAFEL